MIPWIIVIVVYIISIIVTRKLISIAFSAFKDYITDHNEYQLVKEMRPNLVMKVKTMFLLLSLIPLCINLVLGFAAVFSAPKDFIEIANGAGVIKKNSRY